MRLTWKDGLATVLLGIVAAITLATTQAWGWPLLGTARSAGIVLFGVGIVMCALGGPAASTSSSMRDPYVATASVLGGLELAALVGLLVTGDEAWFLGLAAGIGALWAITTFHHAVIGSSPRAHPLPAR